MYKPESIEGRSGSGTGGGVRVTENFVSKH